jgi:hypothetical protein
MSRNQLRRVGGPQWMAREERHGASADGRDVADFVRVATDGLDAHQRQSALPALGCRSRARRSTAETSSRRVSAQRTRSGRREANSAPSRCALL